MRVAVLGSGPSGLNALYTLANCRIADLEIICYERADETGGEWLFTDEIGNDKYGLPIHGSMYRGMRANLPKLLMTVHPDFPWPEDVEEFPSRESVLKYIQDFALKFQLDKFIRFAHFVHRVSKDPKSSKLVVNVENLRTRMIVEETFDFVLMCGGKHGEPRIVHDTSNFAGTVLHYHDLKDPSRLCGKRVVIIGSGFGAMDMVIHLFKIASKLTLSYHKKPPFFGEHGVPYKPEIISFNGNLVNFVDGTSDSFDVLLYATGFYQHSPLDPDIDLDWETGRMIFFPLYKHIVHPKCPSVLFIGKAVSATILASRIQAQYACKVIQGEIVLPTVDEMLQSIANFRSNWIEKLTKPSLNWREYMPKVEMEFHLANETAETAGCPPIPTYLKRIYYSLVQIVNADLMNYQLYTLKLFKSSSGEYDFAWSSPNQLTIDSS